MRTHAHLVLRAHRAIWALLLQNVSAWWLWGETSIPDEVPPLNFSVLVGEEAGREWLQGAEARSGDSTAALEGVSTVQPPLAVTDYSVGSGVDLLLVPSVSPITACRCFSTYVAHAKLLQ